jgi:hypothetical protein
MATRLAKTSDELKALTKISIFAKKPANGGTPAKLKKASMALKPNRGLMFEIDAKSTNVLLFSWLKDVFNDKTIDQIQRLVTI